MSLVSQMFGTAASVAYARCGGSGNNALNVLASLASGFGTDTGNGTYVYNLFNAQTGFTQSGFQNSDTYTTSLENVVGGILGISGNALVGTAAIIYSYANFPNIPETSVIGYLNSFGNAFSSIGGGGAAVINQSGLEHAMRSFSLSGINNSLAQLPSGSGYQKAINYNWYDASGLFANPNLASLAQNIKDSENQYYYLSGEILYPTIPSGLVPCVEFVQNVMTPTGQISFSVIANPPCYRSDTYVGPLSGAKFFREFNDGPGSSGYFDSGTQSMYVSFDEAILSYNDFHSNTDILYSNERDASGFFIYLISGGQVDSQGFYNPNNEYGVGHTNVLVSSDTACKWSVDDFAAQATTYFSWADYTGLGLPLQRMHQGDNSAKWILTKYCTATDGFGNCISCGFTGQLNNWTGWKFASFQLKESLARNYEFMEMNPAMDTSRVIKRVFNLNNNSGTSPITPYAAVVDTGDGILTCTGIVGPPQLNSDFPSMPGFVFYQTFDNITFPDTASLVMRAAVESGGSYIISNFDLLSTGVSGHYPVFGSPALVPIFSRITSSGLASFDDVAKKCMSIGDNFGGNGVSGVQTQQSNAGYTYTGYTYYQSGTLVNVNQLLANNSTTVGSAYSTINYISGYTGVGGTVYSTTEQYAFIITGDTASGIRYFGQPIIYSYFADGTLGSVNTGWNTFAPIPAAIVNDIANNFPRQFGEVYKSQPVENFAPRYSSGPYLSYENTFLYPNALGAFTGFNASANGFPTPFSYEMQFQEETVTELYCIKNKYGFTNYPNIIRATGNGSTGSLKTSMVSPFAPDNQNFNSLYSLSNTGLYPKNGVGIDNLPYPVPIGVEMVDANWIPSINFTSDSSLNSVIHGSSSPISTQWKCGVKINSGIVPKVMFTGVGKSGLVYQNTPVVKQLFWGYYGKTITGVLNYTLPIYNLETDSLLVDSGLNNKIITEAAIPGCRYCFFEYNSGFSLNGSNLGNLNGLNNFSGQEPISYGYIGGRIGSGASLQGGNNPLGICGDSWYDLSIDTWGQRNANCDSAYNSYAYSHGPEGDSHIFFIGLSNSGITINTKSLNYYPYYLQKTYQPFKNIVAGNQVTNMIPRWDGEQYFFDFDLKPYFPLTILSSDSLYSNGLNVGPFDRDVELCVLSGNSIVPSGILISNGEIKNNLSSLDGCLQFVSNIQTNSGIIPGEGNRSSTITTFQLIPSGETVNLNMSGASGSVVGLKNNSIITIRPRVFDGSTALQHPINGADYTSIFGDGGYLNFDRFINNGAEGQFFIPFQSFDFNSIVGKSFQFQTAANQTLLYPKPDADFTGIVPTGIDRFGNTTYPPNPTAYYWAIKTPNAFFTGIRDVTRVSFTVNKIEVGGLGDIPYQGQRIIIPSGECVISGIYGYTGQAESAVISDGIALSGLSGARSLSGLFQPLYVSDVMTRIPSAIFNIPSGSGYRPVLPAPSYMKTRQNPFFITGDDPYINTSPFSGAGYNAFLWPAWSDLGLLNPELVYEAAPPDDGNVFLNSYLTFSAAQGQKIGATGFNIRENVTYKVVGQFGMVDTTATNAIYNTGTNIFSGFSEQTILDSGNLSGILTSEGNSLTMAINLQNFKI